MEQPLAISANHSESIICSNFSLSAPVLNTLPWNKTHAAVLIPLVSSPGEAMRALVSPARGHRRSDPTRAINPITCYHSLRGLRNLFDVFSSTFQHNRRSKNLHVCFCSRLTCNVYILMAQNYRSLHEFGKANGVTLQAPPCPHALICHS